MTRIKELELLITQAKQNYYNGQPTVTDQVFDAWVDELKLLDSENSAVTSIGSEVIPSEWKKCKHQITMSSLDKVNTPEELQKWYVRDDLFIAEKLDGLSINCEYKNGTLVRAITRGSGVAGEDILTNVIKMKGIKLNIPGFDGSIRGEIVLFKSLFNKYFNDKANPRNAAAGIARRLDGVGAEHLTVMFYGLYGNKKFQTEHETFDWMKSIGLLVPNYFVFNATEDNTELLLDKPFGYKNKSVVNDAIMLWKEYQTNRDKLDYDIDGLVVRYDNLSYQESFGMTNDRPKGARAFKFDNVFVETDFKEILWQVGNSGRVTPVGVVKTVNLCGTDVSRASLYNVAYIRSLGLTTSAKVLITKANEIIPRIEQVSVASGDPVTIPTHCPECNEELEMEGENLVCLNVVTCPAQIEGRLKNWIKGLGILEWGDALLTRLVETGLVNDVADLYTLSYEDLVGLERMGDRSAKKCLEILHNNKELSLDVFLGSLSIKMNSQSTIKKIIDSGFNNVDEFLKATKYDFCKVDGLGDIKSQYLVEGLMKCAPLIDKLLENGVSIKTKAFGTLTGKSFCFSGKFSIKRDELEKMVINAGGEAKNRVGKGLTYLVLENPDSMSGKAKDARKNSTEIISEKEFLEMLQ